MNVEQALNAADGSETEGLCGLYPIAAQVLACEVRDLRATIERAGIHAESSRLLSKIRSVAKTETDIATIGFFVRRIINGEDA